MRVIDLAGQRFGRLTVLTRAPHQPEHGTKAAWHCVCDCGQRSVVTSSNLRRGLVRSCGCLRDDKARARHLTHGEARSRSKGTRPSREYRSWSAMKTRCENPKQASYANYGGRGVQICAEWRASFEAFLRDMGRCPPNHSLDRIDNEGHYEPGNCRWAPLVQQANNTRTNRRLTFNGETLTIAQWARKLGIPRDRLKQRLRRGWPLERALRRNLERLSQREADQE